MPLTEKGEKIMTAMKEKYGPEKGEKVFHASKNAGKITGVDTVTIGNSSWKVDVELPRGRADDNQHMGFSAAGTQSVEKLVAHCDALAQRLDAFEKRKNQQQPIDVKPKIKDNMQPSNPHPKDPGG
jgi:hypothetical protein